MPGFNKTGPQGEGPATGRVLGRCGGTNQPQGSEIGRGRRMNRSKGKGPAGGRRAGRGRGQGGLRRGGRM
jgi:hypothetical protein